MSACIVIDGDIERSVKRGEFMRQPDGYTPSEIKKWDVDTEVNGRWVPVRPEPANLLYHWWNRCSKAWDVLVGKADVLYWEG